MINTQNTPYRKLLMQSKLHLIDSKYFKFLWVGKPGEVNRQPYFMLLPKYQLVASFWPKMF